jgi:hypothetical protein
VHFVAGQQDAGRACPYCRSVLAPGIEVVRCGTCESVHHADCWSTNRGCAIVACVGGPDSAPAEPPPPPQTPGRGPLVIDVAPGRRLSWFTIAVLVLVAVLVVAGAAIVLAAAAPLTLLANAAEVCAC